MLCTPKLRGYSLKTKKWLDFFLEFVSDIKWNVNAFDSLVFPEDQKELIRAVSKSQVKNREVFDDVIQGKGKGIIILLSGAPGVGKTLTAEAIADDMHVPLHTITSGDLGSNSWEVESALSKVLDLVSQWNAILLLDECDVFLESRSTNDFKRNEIVSIFLRILEYYEGILFMTTNRADNIDTAFRSRIHISIEYPNLGTCARHQIWRNLLKTSTKPNELSYTDIDELAAVELNGRQIKNILKMAQLLANWKETALKRDFVNTVLALENRSQSAMDGFAPYSVRGLATSKKVALSIGFCIGVAVALAGLGIFGNFKHLI
jgi:SpoVK/Ycf46/Vps4 family AAA+-type ATPase